MSHVAGPYSSANDRSGRSGVSVVWEYFSVIPHLVRTYGLKGLVVLVLAALFAFAPLSLLYWCNEWRLAGVLTANPRGPLLVKSGQWEQEQEAEQPGETALLQVICEATSFDRTQPLLRDDDPRRIRDGQFESWFVTREMVYVRPTEFASSVPFALLGKPPVSVWLPAGDYEILVVHGVSADETRRDGRPNYFPLASVFSECKLENKQKTVCRVRLPHYGVSDGLEPVAGEGYKTAADELMPFIQGCENLAALPTPGGYVLSLAEPVVTHEAEHRRCTIDFAHGHAVPREWTREQLAIVRNWLPKEATTPRARLSALVDSLGWREFFQGWYCYAAAGITGLIFTRWGAIAMLEPWRRGESFFETVGLLCKVFCVSLAVWCVFLFLTDS